MLIVNRKIQKQNETNFKNCSIRPSTFVLKNVVCIVLDGAYFYVISVIFNTSIMHTTQPALRLQMQ